MDHYEKQVLALLKCISKGDWFFSKTQAQQITNRDLPDLQRGTDFYFECSRDAHSHKLSICLHLKGV